MRIEDIRELLRRYPVVAEVPLEQPEEFTRAGMVRVKFHGDKEVGMALGLFDQRPGESRQEWKERLDHIVNGWAVEEISEVVDVEQAVPVVRSVDYFMPRGRFRTPMWDRLTEFIGMGLAIDTPSQIQFLNSSDLPEDRSPENVARLRERACINLVNLSQPPLVQELPHGPDVVTFTTPHAYQASWFAHTEVLADALNHYQRTTNTPWLVLPALRKDLVLINSASPGWAPGGGLPRDGGLYCRFQRGCEGRPVHHLGCRLLRPGNHQHSTRGPGGFPRLRHPVVRRVVRASHGASAPSGDPARGRHADSLDRLEALREGPEGHRRHGHQPLSRFPTGHARSAPLGAGPVEEPFPEWDHHLLRQGRLAVAVGAVGAVISRFPGVRR